MSRAHQLRDALDRALDRTRYCQRELDRFHEGADMSEPAQERTFMKLRGSVTPDGSSTS